MKKAQILEELIKEHGFSIRSFAQKCGIPESTLYTILKKGAGRASVNTILLMCKNLGITVEELDALENGTAVEKTTQSTYEDVTYLLARNSKDFSIEQKMHLIQLLSEIQSET